MSSSPQPLTLRQVLEAILDDRLPLLPALVAANTVAEAALGGPHDTDLTSAVTNPKEWTADDLRQLAESRCVVVTTVPHATGDDMKFQIGRSRKCDYRIADESVSASHAVLIVDRGSHEYRICDVESRNGTMIDATLLKPNVPALLWSGAVLTFGRARFCFLDPLTLRKLAHVLHGTGRQRRM